MSDIRDQLSEFAQQVADDFPDLKAIMDEAAAGTIDEGEALERMSLAIMENPEIARRFQETALAALAPMIGETPPVDPNGVMMVKERGLPQMNPLVEAAIIERAQFDGDIPELRTGGMPRGAKPAVAVDTDVRNPAALGEMLTEASDQVAEEVEKADQKRLEMVKKVAGGDSVEVLTLLEESGKALTVPAVEDMVFDGKTDLVDAPEYKRGQVPAPVVVQKPSGSALLAMTPQQRRENAWKFLSTTQGRRTALAGLRELVEVKLTSEGFKVDVVETARGETPQVLAHHKWTVRIDGAGSTQSAFNLIDIAAAAISKGLTRECGEYRGPVALEVVTVDTVDLRSVGWAGRLLEVGSGRRLQG